MTTNELDPVLVQQLPTMEIFQIAAVIRKDWKNVYFGAVPYLGSMRSMNSIRDNFGADDGRSIVAYFLSNASTWRGPVAKAVKAELKKRLKSS